MTTFCGVATTPQRRRDQSSQPATPEGDPLFMPDPQLAQIEEVIRDAYRQIRYCSDPAQ